MTVDVLDVNHRPLLVGLLVSAGCAGGPPCVAPTAVRPLVPHELGDYRLGCADVLEVTFVTQPEWDCAASIGLDGRLSLGAAGKPLVEGLTLVEARAAVAKAARLDEGAVIATLADARAKRLYLSGPENDIRRMVPYLGPERVTAFLERAGALKPNCTELRRIHVLRQNLARNAEPELFPVDLIAVLRYGDDRSDIVLEPSDQIIVGETRRSAWSRSIPDWFRPVYDRLVGLRP